MKCGILWACDGLERPETATYRGCPMDMQRLKFLTSVAVVALTLGNGMDTWAQQPARGASQNSAAKPVGNSTSSATKSSSGTTVSTLKKQEEPAQSKYYLRGGKFDEVVVFGDYRLPSPINPNAPTTKEVVDPQTGKKTLVDVPEVDRYYFTIPAANKEALAKAGLLEEALAYAKVLSMIVYNQLNPAPIPTVAEAMDGKVFNKLTFMRRGYLSPKGENADFLLGRLIKVLDPKASVAETAAWNSLGAPYNVHIMKQCPGVLFNGGGACGSGDIFTLGLAGGQDQYYVRSTAPTYSVKIARDNVLYIINRTQSGLEGVANYPGDLALVSRQISQAASATKSMTLQNILRTWQREYDTGIKPQVLAHYRGLADQARKDAQALSSPSAQRIAMQDSSQQPPESATKVAAGAVCVDGSGVCVPVASGGEEE